MGVKYFVIFGCILGVSQWMFTETLANMDGEYRVNDTSTEVSEDPTGYLESTADPSSPLDSHEAMNNRELIQKSREKRSFEFLVGLINNNSKYEVIRSDPISRRNRENQKKNENQSSEATKLLLELITKIVAYPENWRRVHQILKNLDEDLTNSQHLLKQHQRNMESSNNLLNTNPLLNKKSEGKENQDKSQYHQLTTIGNKWPTFDEDQDEASTEVSNQQILHQKQNSKTGEKTTYQKNFAYHKVTGKPTHLKKSPSAYIAVSAISPKPSNSEEDFILETELHRLKPWRNKNFLRNV